jgi:rhodanese-related sulfurtransferase
MTSRSPGPTRRGELKRVILEALCVGALGLGAALVANQISPRGLALTRNYFPSQAATAVQTTPSAIPLEQRPTTSHVAAVEVVRADLDLTAAHLADRGMQVIEHTEVVGLFRDPRYLQELVIFVDARDDQHYQAGHVPGAYQFDHYYPENHLPTVLPACLNANRIVVYCQGGDCEDSEFATLTLHEAGVPLENLWIYAGGFAQWRTNGLPVETGARHSGSILNSEP